jgi:hypothetical protein
MAKSYALPFSFSVRGTLVLLLVGLRVLFSLRPASSAALRPACAAVTGSGTFGSLGQLEILEGQLLLLDGLAPLVR